MTPNCDVIITRAVPSFVGAFVSLQSQVRQAVSCKLKPQKYLTFFYAWSLRRKYFSLGMELPQCVTAACQGNAVRLVRLLLIK